MKVELVRTILRRNLSLILGQNLVVRLTTLILGQEWVGTAVSLLGLPLALLHVGVTIFVKVSIGPDCLWSTL